MPLWSLWGSPAKLSLLPLRFELPSLRIILIVVVEIASWAFAPCGVLFTQQLSAGINLLRCHWPHFTDGEVTEAAGSQVGNQNKNILPWPRAVFPLEDPYYSASWWSNLAFLFTAVASASGTFPDHVCTHVMCVLWTDCSVSLSGDSLYKPPRSTLTLRARLTIETL